MLLTYSKMTVLDCLKPLTLSAVGNGDRMLRNTFLLFANARGAGTLSTAKCPAPGTHRAINGRGLPGGMLAAGIDSHIIYILRCILLRFVMLADFVTLYSYVMLKYVMLKCHVMLYFYKFVCGITS